MPALRPRWSKNNRTKRTVTKWKKQLEIAEKKLAEDKANPRYQHNLNPRDRGNVEFQESRITVIKENITKLEKKID